MSDYQVSKFMTFIFILYLRGNKMFKTVKSAANLVSGTNCARALLVVYGVALVTQVLQGYVTV